MSDTLEDLLHDKNMRDDEMFAVECYEDQILEAYDLLKLICDKLSNYGHELSPKELLDYV